MTDSTFLNEPQFTVFSTGRQLFWQDLEEEAMFVDWRHPEVEHMAVSSSLAKYV